MKYKLAAVMLGFLIICSNLFAQGPDTVWTRAYHQAYDQIPYDVCEVKGGFVIAGGKNLVFQGNYNATLTKIDPSGTFIWSRAYGSPYSEILQSVQCTSDNGLIAVGSSTGSSYSVVLLKTDGDGNLIWRRYISPDGIHTGNVVRQTSDGGYIIAAEAWGPDAAIIKTDSIGNLEWSSVFGYSNEDRGFGVCEVREGGYALVGYKEVQPGGHLPAWLIRIGENGDSLWSRGYERGGCDFRAVEETPDGGFIMAGRSTIDNGNWWDVYLVRTNANGDTLWTRTFGGGQWDAAISVQRTYDGGFFVGAYTFSYGPDVGFLFIKTDSLGNLLFQQAVGTDVYDWALGAIQCRDGSYLMVGPQYINERDSYDIYAVKLFPDEYMGADDPGMQPHTFSLSQNYPNPFNAQTTISYSLAKAGPVTLSINNIMGQKVATLVDGIEQAGEHKVVWDAGKVSSGIYFARLIYDNNSKCKRMVLLK